MAVRMDRASILVGVWRVESARRAEEKDGVVVLSMIAFWTFVVKIRDDADVDVDVDVDGLGHDRHSHRYLECLLRQRIRGFVRHCLRFHLDLPWFVQCGFC